MVKIYQRYNITLQDSRSHFRDSNNLSSTNPNLYWDWSEGDQQPLTRMSVENPLQVFKSFAIKTFDFAFDSRSIIMPSMENLIVLYKSLIIKYPNRFYFNIINRIFILYKVLVLKRTSRLVTIYQHTRCALKQHLIIGVHLIICT